MAAVNADKTNIWDEAEVYILAAADVADIEALVPDSVDEDLDAQWTAGFVGLIDAGKGIPMEPSVEIKHYDAYGHARYRSKASKGTVATGFTCFEDNDVTKMIVLPGSRPGKVGAPKNLRYYTCYRTVDEGKVKVAISARPALLELTGHSGAVEGEQEAYEFSVHHANDHEGDVFFVVESTVADALEVTTASLPAGKVGTAYSQTLAATGGVGTKTWSTVSTLPAGLTLSNSGVLAGTPTAAGTPSVSFKVTDSAKPPVVASKAITVTVSA